MKHLLILPGNSPNNEAWGMRMAAHYSQYFDSFHTASYAHWQMGEADIDFGVELEALKVHVATLPNDATIYVLAKSAGSILAFLSIHAHIVQPTYVAFFGIPFEFAAVDVFAHDWSAVTSFTVPAIAFHNTHDPVAPYDYTKSVLENRAPTVSFITLSGNDHNYDEYELYDQYLVTVFQK